MGFELSSNGKPKLTEPERERLLARLHADSDAANNEKFDWFFVRQAFKDHLVWGYAMLFHGFAFVLYSLSLFMVSHATMCVINTIANSGRNISPQLLLVLDSKAGKHSCKMLGGLYSTCAHIVSG
jgi:hypothetical protein